MFKKIFRTLLITEEEKEAREKKLAIEEKEFLRHAVQSLSDRLFSSVVGYDDLKLLITRCILNKGRQHVLLFGPPATSKTVFLLALKDKLPAGDCYYISGKNLTAAGLTEYWFNNPTIKYILIDEIDKAPTDAQKALLDPMETGILNSTKVRKTGTINNIQTKIFATTNSIDNLIEPLKSRFRMFELPEYEYADFEEITIKLLADRYGLGRDIAIRIASAVWKELESKDIRKVLEVGSLADKQDAEEDITWLIKVAKKYAPKDEENYN